MKVKENKDILTISKVTENLTDFIKKLESQQKTFDKFHLIIDLGKEATLSDLLLFESIFQKHQELSKSFVLVVQDTDFTDFDHPFMTVVPSILEAHDIIEMEEIERDLGF